MLKNFELCSKEVCHRVRVVNHDCRGDNMIALGQTSRGTEVAVNPIIAEADRVIMTGGVIYHYMAGFGGGRTIILVTRPENFALARKAHLEPAADMKAALELAYQRRGTTEPTITVMPQGANTFPIVAS